jgi:peptidyl-prolyl cis-trans isomerase D
MLQSMRQGAKDGITKYVLLGLLALGAGGLVLTDVGGFFRGGVGSTDVARAGDVKIGIRQFDRNVRRYLQQDYMTPQEAYRMGLIDTILQNEINARLLAQETYHNGLRISDDEVTRQIANMTKDMSTTEESRRLALQRMLRERGIGEEEFVSAIRQETSITLLRNAILNGTAVAPNQLVNDLYQFQTETRDINLITLKDDSVKDVVKPDESTLQTYYEANQLQFVVPETRGVTIATLKPESIADTIEITDEDLQAEYEHNIDSFEIPARRSIQQAVVQEEEEAQKIYDLIKGGKSFKDAVTEVRGSATNYLGEDEFEKDGLVEEISGPAFSAKEGEVLEPIRTPLGWHILKIVKAIPVDHIPFDDVKKDLKDQLIEERLADTLIDTANAVDDMLAGGEALETVVNEYNLTTEKVSGFRASGLDADDKDLFKEYGNDRAEMLELAFGYEEGETAPVIELADGSFIAIHIDTVTDQFIKPLADVKDQLEKQWVAEQKQALNRANAEEAYAALQDGSKSLSDIGSVKTYNDLLRTDDKGAPLSREALAQVFDLGPDDFFMAPMPGGFVLGSIKDITLKTPDKDSEEYASIRKRAYEAIPQEVTNIYMHTISQEQKVKINRALLEQAYGAQETQ